MTGDTYYSCDLRDETGDFTYHKKASDYFKGNDTYKERFKLDNSQKRS